MAIFEKNLRTIAATIKDEYIKKYVLDYYLEEISKLSPNLVRKGYYNQNSKKNTLSGAGSFFIPFGTKFKNTSKINFQRGYGLWGGIDRFDPPGWLKQIPESNIGFLIGHGEVLPSHQNKVTLSSKLDRLGIPLPHINCKWGENEKKMAEHMKITIQETITSAGGKVLPLKIRECGPLNTNCNGSVPESLVDFTKQIILWQGIVKGSSSAPRMIRIWNA